MDYFCCLLLIDHDVVILVRSCTWVLMKPFSFFLSFFFLSFFFFLLLDKKLWLSNDLDVVILVRKYTSDKVGFDSLFVFRHHWLLFQMMHSRRTYLWMLCMWDRFISCKKVKCKHSYFGVVDLLNLIVFNRYWVRLLITTALILPAQSIEWRKYYMESVYRCRMCDETS